MSVKKIVFWTTMLVFLASGPAFSMVEREVIIMVRPGTIVLPEGRNFAPIDSVTITTDTLRSILVSFNPELVLKAFPNFNLSDTIAISPLGDTIKMLDLSLVYKVQLPRGISNKLVAEALETMPGVVFALPNGTRQIFAPVVPNDPDFYKQWGLKNTGETGGIPGADIKATDAWEITTGNNNIKIGIIDDGIYGNHPDLY